LTTHTLLYSYNIVNPLVLLGHWARSSKILKCTTLKLYYSVINPILLENNMSFLPLYQCSCMYFQKVFRLGW